MNDELIKAIAEKLKEEFVIGNWSQFCDETDFDHASVEDVMSVIKELVPAPAPAQGGAE